MYRVEAYVPMLDEKRQPFGPENYIAIESIILEYANGFSVYSIVGCYMSPDGVLVREPMILYKIDSENADRLRLLAAILDPEITTGFNQEEVKIEFYELTAPQFYYFSAGYVGPLSEQLSLEFKDEG
jgi:hypothetical protein